MLNLVSFSTQSLASCVNYFVWNCFTCFSNTKIGSVTSFSILFNFQGPVRLSRPADDLIILSQKWFFVKHFFRSVSNILNLDRFRFLRTNRELVGARPLHFLRKPLVCSNTPLGWFVASQPQNLSASIGSFLSLLSWGFGSHSFVSALGAQV